MDEILCSLKRVMEFEDGSLCVSCAQDLGYCNFCHCTRSESAFSKQGGSVALPFLLGGRAPGLVSEGSGHHTRSHDVCSHTRNIPKRMVFREPEKEFPLQVLSLDF